MLVGVAQGYQSTQTVPAQIDPRAFVSPADVGDYCVQVVQDLPSGDERSPRPAGEAVAPEVRHVHVIDGTKQPLRQRAVDRAVGSNAV
jgi:hypothetical protein